jgi:hypothetical protein
LSKKPSAALSSNLVAVKGSAAPASDMPGRGAPTALAPDSNDTMPAATRAPAGGGEGTLAPLNFRVRAGFRREFKTYAARHDLKLNELLRLSFDAYRRERGD